MFKELCCGINYTSGQQNRQKSDTEPHYHLPAEPINMQVGLRVQALDEGDGIFSMQLSESERGHLDTYCRSLRSCPRLHTPQTVAFGWDQQGSGLEEQTEAFQPLLYFWSCNQMSSTLEAGQHYRNLSLEHQIVVTVRFVLLFDYARV